ncbi:hypothetical protein JCM8208_001793 [Rhodotorula glutinis]
MAPKAKASTSSKTNPASKKRSTRADTTSDDDSSPPPAKKPKTKATKASSSTKATTKPAAKSKKPKKKTEEMVLSSDSDHSSDSDVVIEQPKKKRAGAPSSKPKAKATSSKPKSKAALAARTPIEASTSTPAESLAEAPKKKKDKKPPKELPFDEALPLWFAQFADKGDKTKMDGDGIEKLFGDMDLSMDGAYPLILAWKVGAKPGTFGAFFLDDFERAFRHDKIASSAKLKDFLIEQEQVLLKPRAGGKGKGKAAAAPGTSSDSEDLYRGPDADTVANQSFQQFYAFLLPFFRAEGSKTLPAEAAKAMWTVVLAPKYELAQGFVDFAEHQGDKFKAVSTDLWTQLLDFCETVEPDLTGWSEDDAWPSAIDAFVEWKREKEGAA